MQKVKRGKVVGFKPLMEQWNYYALEDGMILGVKVVVSKVMRAVSPEGESLNTPDGDPVYTYNTANVSQVLTPDEYRSMTGSITSV
jgi:hypothetical protein